MLGRFSLVGGLLSTLIAGFLSATDTFAAQINGTATIAGTPVSTESLVVTKDTPVITENSLLDRPSKSELENAVQRLQNLGDYQKYFGPNAPAFNPSQIPHYAEYDYLNRLIVSVQTDLIDRYNDTSIDNQRFEKALEEMQHAYRGCSLIFNASKASLAAGNAQLSTNSANSVKPASTPAQPAKTPVAPATTAKTTVATPKAKPTTPTASKAETPKSDTAIAVTVVKDDADDIEVPATGELTDDPANRRASWPALIAIVITGALAASIAIAIIVRREPTYRRSHHRR